MKFIFNNREVKPNWRTNWGDNIALTLIKALSDNICQRNFLKKIESEHIFGLLKPEQQSGLKNGKLVSIGSVMNYTMPNDFVWGTGCIKQGSIGKKPKKVTAVRGPLTRNELILAGWECPEIYGDPALLMPMLYSLKSKPKYKWGVIPHYVEFEDEYGLKTLKNLEKLGFKIIDVCNGTIEFLEELAECENILSSSLHGLIISDAYGIPNARISIRNALVGGHFKFVDYCTSINRPIDWATQITPDTTMNDIHKIKLNDKITFNSDNLFYAAPWNLDIFKQILS